MATIFNDKPFEVENRRYIGCKAKLATWIMNTIQENTQDVSSFCDIFAGTGVISKFAIESKRYNRVVINDFLLSNNVIYKAFFGLGGWDKDKLCGIAKGYNEPTNELLKENWFSINYGGKYFDEFTARRIGNIREDIGNRRDQLTEKEFAILLASLIYSIDKLANTVGHFDSYIKRTIKCGNMSYRLINAGCFENVWIYQKDANELARDIDTDVVYIDPPYNSRQYSRFYHIYETLIKWDKPKLYGTALKPKATNMSAYCSCQALNTFENLIQNLKTKYIAVSYNNTYNSKSHSSENKIQLEQIGGILGKRGETKIFTHNYHAFNAGKTDIKGHKEYLFITHINS